MRRMEISLAELVGESFYLKPRFFSIKPVAPSLGEDPHRYEMSFGPRTDGSYYTAVSSFKGWKFSHSRVEDLANMCIRFPRYDTPWRGYSECEGWDWIYITVTRHKRKKSDSYALVHIVLPIPGEDSVIDHEIHPESYLNYRFGLQTTLDRLHQFGRDLLEEVRTARAMRVEAGTADEEDLELISESIDTSDSRDPNFIPID